MLIFAISVGQPFLARMRFDHFLIWSIFVEANSPCALGAWNDVFLIGNALEASRQYLLNLNTSRLAFLFAKVIRI